jgi:hypothetical protein
MTRAPRSAADSGRYQVTSDVHLVLLNDRGQVLLGRRQNCRSALAAIADGQPFSLSGW